MQPTKPSNGAGCFDGPYLTPVVRDGAIQRWRGQWDGYSRDFFFGRDSRPPASAPLPASAFRREGVMLNGFSREASRVHHRPFSILSRASAA